MITFFEGENNLGLHFVSKTISSNLQSLLSNTDWKSRSKVTETTKPSDDDDQLLSFIDWINHRNRLENITLGNGSESAYSALSGLYAALSNEDLLGVNKLQLTNHTFRSACSDNLVTPIRVYTVAMETPPRVHVETVASTTAAAPCGLLLTIDRYLEIERTGAVTESVLNAMAAAVTDHLCFNRTRCFDLRRVAAAKERGAVFRELRSVERVQQCSRFFSL